MATAAEQEGVGLGLAGEQLAHLGVELGHDLGGALGVGRLGLGLQRRDAGRLGIGVRDARVKPLAAQHDQHPVLRLGDEHHVHAGDVDALAQPTNHLGRLVVGDAARPAVDDVAGVVQGGEVAARSDVARLQLDVEAGRRQGPPAQLVLQGVVAEQPEMPRPRARRDAGPDGLDESYRPLGRQLVEVRRRRLFELAASGGVGVPAEAVHHHEHDPGVGRLNERREVEPHMPETTARL
jgi:hypothetical protein